MSLEALTEQIEQNRKDGEKLQDQWSRRIKDIRSDENLSDAGKTQQLAVEYNTFLARARELRENEKTIVKNKLQDLQRQVESRSGTSSTDIIAFRDAQDRADRLNRDEAIAVIQRAMRQGDTSLAHAVFRRAVEAGWRNVTEAFITENPDLSDVVRDINDLHAFQQNSFERTMSYAIFAA